MEHYRSNPQPYKVRAVQRRKAVKHRWWEWLATQSCVDCGETDPDLLECDHVDGKTMGIGALIRKTSSWEKVKVELERCVVRCVKCHRKKTARQFGWSRLVQAQRDGSGQVSKSC